MNSPVMNIFSTCMHALLYLHKNLLKLQKFVIFEETELTVE